MARLGFILFLLSAINGCGFVNFKDISSCNEYKELVDTTYRTKKNFLILGINMGGNPKEFHQYAVVNEPGFGGPEVITHDSLPINSVFQIKKVLVCTNCFLDFSPRIKYLIEIKSDNNFKDYDIFLDDSFGSKQNSITSKDRVKMNPKMFELIEQ